MSLSWSRLPIAGVLGMLMVGTFAGPGIAAAGDTTLVSVSSGQVQGNGASQDAAVSADGRYVAFTSGATNLVPDDTNFRNDVFVHDRQTAATERVNVSSTGGQADLGGGTTAFSLSADGRFVAFTSFATNLVVGDTNNITDIFVRDRQAGTTERVSVSSLGGQTDNRSEHPAISADGRYVTFSSIATNLVGNDTNGLSDIFVHDRLTRETTRVSPRRGRQSDGSSTTPSISGDGRFVAFNSAATNLVPRDTNGAEDIFVTDRQTGATERVSISGTGAQADRTSRTPAINADGRFIAFSSFATNLVADDTNRDDDIFVRDRLAGTTQRVSLSTAGTEGNSGSTRPFISAEGRLVAFQSFASNLVAGDTNGRTDVFVRDRVTGTTERVSVSSAGAQGDGSSEEPSVSADGAIIAFHSFATNFIEGGDANGTSADVFVHELR